MVTALQSKAELAVLADDATDQVTWMLRRSSGSWETRRLQLLDTIPGVVGFYSEGSAALAADFYDDSRSQVRAPTLYRADPVILDRTVSIRRQVAWASEPLSIDDADLAAARFAELMRAEMRRPYQDTIMTNQKRDPACVGWRRVTAAGACSFCRMLADRGAVYKESTATFAAHSPVDNCTAAPVFLGGEVGPEADTMQYVASRRSKTPKQKAELAAYLAEFYPAV